LRPGIKGISDNIHVRSIIGRFLEHTRIYYFHNDGKPRLYCASADWMPRNLFHRIEACFPIEEKRPRDQVIKLGLMNYLSDNTQAWILQADGNYRQAKPGSSAKPRSAQQSLLEHFCG
ncbi:MAG: RNA degradosome polyphosphate kinase, partial [Gammaproteobacteria bacterium]